MNRHILELLCRSLLFWHIVEATLYTKYPGIKLQTCLVSITTFTLTKCAAECSIRDHCKSGSHVHTTGQCCLWERYFYQEGASFASDPDAVYFQPQEDHATDGQWTMVFRGESGNGQNVYDAVLNTGTYHDYPLGRAPHSIACWAVSASGLCTGHVRSVLLDMWNSGQLTPTKVKYAFYKNGAEVANVVFNGVGSTLHTWFDPTRVISSSYSDLTPSQTYNYFSFFGTVEFSVERRFYVSQTHNGCEDDWGWMVVVENKLCGWEMVGDLPLFLYSSSTTLSHWDPASEGKADVMAIFVQL